MSRSNFLMFCSILMATSICMAKSTCPRLHTKDNSLSKNYAFPFFDFTYFNFKFNSVTGTNFQRFQGHSDQYRAGGDVLISSLKLLTGVFIYHVDTDLTAQSSFSPFFPVSQIQNIKNNLLSVHITKFIGMFAVDVAGAYGHFKMNDQLTIAPNTTNQITGFGNNSNSNWYASIAGLYARNWQKLKFNGVVRLLHGEVNYKQLLIHFNSPIFNPLAIAPLTNKATWVIENMRIGYQLNSLISPYVTGSLVQVTHFNNSRALIAEPILGGLPQLSLNKNGFIIGGGVNAQIKKFNLTIEQTYYQTGSIYHSNQTLVRLGYMWS